MEADIYKDLIFCGLCGSKFTRECGLTNRSGGKVRNYQYRCVNKETRLNRKRENWRKRLRKRHGNPSVIRMFSLSGYLAKSEMPVVFDRTVMV